MSESDSQAHDDDAAAATERSTGGLPDPEDVEPDELDAIEREREERLAPENRPDGAEVDNTPRDFDTEAGMFTDRDDYDDSEKRYASDGEA
jgi:hypothetical protein